MVLLILGNSNVRDQVHPIAEPNSHLGFMGFRVWGLRVLEVWGLGV